MSDKDDALYQITPWGCLCETLKDYGFDTSGITAKVGKHMVSDFLELMSKAGHVRYVSEDENDESDKQG